MLMVDQNCIAIIADSPRRPEFEGSAENEFIERNQLQKSEPNNDLVPGFQHPNTRQGVKARTLSYDDLVPGIQRADGRQEMKASTLSYEDELFRKFRACLAWLCSTPEQLYSKTLGGAALLQSLDCFS